jgi:hypothetical protein
MTGLIDPSEQINEQGAERSRDPCNRQRVY